MLLLLLLQAAPDYFLAVRSLCWLWLLAAAAPGLFRLLLAAAGWLLDAAGSPGCSWHWWLWLSWLLLALLLTLLLAAPGTAGCWLPALLAAAGSSPGRSWLLAAPG